MNLTTPEESKPLQVRFADVDYPIITELTEREKFDAERIARCSLNEIGAYSLVQILAYFTLRRQGYDRPFDHFLDHSGFELQEQELPLAQSNGGSASVDETSPTESDGPPTTPPSSGSFPG